jgi:hypothetical protein
MKKNYQESFRLFKKRERKEEGKRKIDCQDSIKEKK